LFAKLNVDLESGASIRATAKANEIGTKKLRSQITVFDFGFRNAIIMAAIDRRITILNNIIII
jgi:hypothetical protein